MVPASYSSKEIVFCIIAVWIMTLPPRRIDCSCITQQQIFAQQWPALGLTDTLAHTLSAWV